MFRLKIYDSAGNAVMVTVGTGMNERQVAVDNNFGVPGNLPSQRNALPFQPDTAGRYYVSIAAPNGGIAPNRVYTLSVQSDDYKGLFAFQVGVRVSRRAQLGLPA